ncbi:MAG: LCP family protein [Lachnospiraceae bacterium]|nr:LCP family protein [Lachnospiraceae bacterium]
MSKARKRNKKGKRLIIILVVEVLIFIGLLIAYGVHYMNRALDSMQIDETDKKEIDVSDAVTEVMQEKYTTIALFGLDTRSNVDMTKKGVSRSDAIVIASINNETKEVKLVSVYRDAFLETATENPSNIKVTEAYMVGGPIWSIETLNKNLDLNITDYVSVDFTALTKAIDALGGVTINVKEKELNNLNHNLEEQIEVTGIASDGVWSAGEQVLNGAQATAYARIRKVGNNDFERTQRQRAVISAMISKAKQSNLSTITKIIEEVFPLIATNMTKTQLISMATNLFEYQLGDNTGFPLANETPTLGSKGSVVVPADLLSNVKHLHEFLYPEDTEYTPSSEVQRISASITNETGVYDEFTDDKITEEPTSTNSDN